MSSPLPPTTRTDPPARQAWALRECVLLAVGLVALVLVVYGKTLDTPLGSDARFLTYQNEWVRSGSGILRFWTHDVFEGAETHGVPYRSGYYRPVLNAFFWLEYRWAGSSATAYHLGELLLHGLNAFLVLLFVTSLTRSRGAGLVAGVLFAVHPINAFAASEPAAGGDVLFTAFYLVALLVFLRALDEEPEGRQVPLGVLAIVGGLYVLSLLSKEMGVTLPAVLLLLVLLRHGREGGALRRWTWTLPAWALLAGYVGWRFVILDLHPSTMGYGATQGRLAVLLATLATIPVHVARLLVPTGPRYPELDPGMIVVVGRGFADPLLWVSLALLALLGMTLVRWRREPELAFCAAFFLVTYSPLFRVNNIGGTLDTSVILTQERWIYLPAIAFVAAVGIGLTRLMQRMPRRQLVPAVAGAAAVACLLAWEASVHAGKYADPFARLRRLYAIPDKYLSRFELANRDLLYADWVAIPSGHLQDAETRARAAEKLVPDSPITAAGLAQVLAREGRWEEVRNLLVPWMYPTAEFLAAKRATNFRVYDDWNRVNPTVTLLLGRAEGHLGDTGKAQALLCDALARGISPAQVQSAADEIPQLAHPLTCPDS
jgi:hypothetical protein